eukprot:XP_002260887.1 hypothetical protein, conserved in Plasmodium species [Plasmodium knowlesi strain H]
MTICVCIAFDTHIFKNIIIGISSILGSPLSIILHSTNKGGATQQVTNQFSIFRVALRCNAELYIVFFCPLCLTLRGFLFSPPPLRYRLINLILLFFLLIIYKKVLSYKRKFDENVDELNVDLYNNINDN